MVRQLDLLFHGLGRSLVVWLVVYQEDLEVQQRYVNMKTCHKLTGFNTVYIITMLMLSLLMIDVIIGRSIAALVYLFSIFFVTICYGFLRRKYM